MTHMMTSRDFNQAASRAKQAAKDGPVFITDRGRPAHVLLSYEHYLRLIGDKRSLAEVFGSPAGIENIDLPAPRHDEMARVADLD